MTPLMTLEVLLGHALDGPRVCELDDLAEGTSCVGTLVVGVGGLLRDLELRLGLVADDTPPPVRVAQYARRLEVLLPKAPFYAASFAKDPLGTARELLRWRDELVSAGWYGLPFFCDRRRLDTLADLEVLRGANVPTLADGIPDRWQFINGRLRADGRRPYTRVRVVDPIELFPHCVRQVLGELGAVVEPLQEIKRASTDLGRLQQHLVSTDLTPFHVEGDGTLTLLEAETPTELAAATASLLAQHHEHAVVVRLCDTAPLDHALRATGLPTQGLSSSSTLRPIFQVLPLVLELAYEPKDPHRVLELLTLPGGPFRGKLGRLLAKAFASRPGLGNSDWEKAKQKWLDDHDEGDSDPVRTSLERLAAWVEARGSMEPHAPRAQLIDVIARVQTWLAGRAKHADDPEQQGLAAQAHAQAGTLVLALVADPRVELSIVELRQLFAEVLGGGHVTQLGEEQGRVDHVTDLAALLVPRDTLVLWGAVDEKGGEPSSPWTPSERDALTTYGLHLPDRAVVLRFRAQAARRAIGLTTKRVIFARPLTQLGEGTAPHPLLDEIIARLGADRAAIARITKTATELLKSEPTQSELPLPRARPTWSLGRGILERRAHLSPSSIETLVGCPLRFVLEKEAGLRDASVASLPSDPNLYGTIGHRLVEELHAQQLIGAGASKNVPRLRKAAIATLDRLLREEATVLLVPGRGDDRAQYRTTIIESILALDDLLRRGALTVVSTEEEVVIDWDGRKLQGRLDLLLRDAKGRDVVLDLKWGSSSYSKKLEAGVAIQLATYAFVRRTQSKAKRLPEAAYFSLRKAQAIALSVDTFPGAQPVEGADLEQTWDRTVTSIAAVEEDLASGRIAVPGVGKQRPAWKSEARMGADADTFIPLATDAACEYCALDAVCGKRWVNE